MLLLGLAGRRGSGKDSVCAALSSWCGAHGYLASRKGFADFLKISAARALGFKGSDEECIQFCDWLKLSGSVQVVNEVEDEDDPFPRITGREFLQLYGTEGHRDVFGADFWINALLPYGEWRDRPDWYDRFRIGGRDPDIAIITDVRFENEAERILDLGGTVWEVSRPEAEGISDSHSSEKPLPKTMIDMVVNNSGSLDDLQTMVANHCEADLKLRLAEKHPSWGVIHLHRPVKA